VATEDDDPQSVILEIPETISPALDEFHLAMEALIVC